MKAIDYWTAGCYVTVFSALLEYCIVLYLIKMAEWEIKARRYIREKSTIATKIRKSSVLPEKPKREKVK